MDNVVFVGTTAIYGKEAEAAFEVNAAWFATREPEYVCCPPWADDTYWEAADDE